MHITNERVCEVYMIRDCFGVRPSSSILKNNKEHKVSETGSLSFLR
jgi:hypothetical protein